MPVGGNRAQIWRGLKRLQLNSQWQRLLNKETWESNWQVGGIITANKLFYDCNIIVQSAMLVTSIECDTLNKKNIDLQEELRLINGKLKSMSVKYNSLEVSYKNISFDLFLYFLF